MTELKENFAQFWNGLKSEFLNNIEKRKLFFITFFTGLVVHFQLYSLILSGPDTIINSLYHKAIRRNCSWTFFFVFDSAT